MNETFVIRLFLTITLLLLSLVNLSYEKDYIHYTTSTFDKAQKQKRSSNDNKVWDDYKIKYNKKYLNENDENIHREAFFRKLELIKINNENFDNGIVSYHLNVNHLTDYTEEDYKKMIGNSFNVSSFDVKERFIFKMKDNVPNSIDWRQYGAVTEVKNQGLCGNGWIFAANGAIESAWRGKSGELISFSEQAVADCTEGDSCKGGWVSKAFEYNKYYGMIMEKEYPYNYKDSQCDIGDKEFVGKISRWVSLQTNDEDYLKLIIGTVGPIAVGIDASLESFQAYSHGIYDDPTCPKTLNHAVLLIGYGKDDLNGEYWLVKNSYGTTWGEQGYLRIRRGLNRCGIAMAAAVPIL
uniref:Cathepsin L n=1 Tax=Parastrongyloides trichosuri TaxID=131310 RepID=A0A0N5A140_PARTI